MSTGTTHTRAFDPRTVPATGSARNRYPHGFHPNGSQAPPDVAYAGIVNNLAVDRQRDAAPITPEHKTVELRKVIRDDRTGDYKLVSRPAASGTITREPLRPGKFAALKVDGVELLNDVLLGGDAYLAATDAQVWDALLAAAEDVQANGRALRQLNDAVAIVVLIRAGILASAYDLRWE